MSCILEIFNNGNSRIVVDDGCYYVENCQGLGKGWKRVSQISKDAIEGLVRPPTNPGDVKFEKE